MWQHCKAVKRSLCMLLRHVLTHLYVHKHVVQKSQQWGGQDRAAILAETSDTPLDHVQGTHRLRERETHTCTWHVCRTECNRHLRMCVYCHNSTCACTHSHTHCMHKSTCCASLSTCSALKRSNCSEGECVSTTTCWPKICTHHIWDTTYSSPHPLYFCTSSLTLHASCVHAVSRSRVSRRKWLSKVHPMTTKASSTHNEPTHLFLRLHGTGQNVIGTSECVYTATTAHAHALTPTLTACTSLPAAHHCRHVLLWSAQTAPKGNVLVPPHVDQKYAHTTSGTPHTAHLILCTSVPPL